MGLTISDNFTSQTQGKPAEGKKPPKVAVIDIFAVKTEPIDPYDNIPDISHGEAIESYIKGQCPAVNIERKGSLNPANGKENSRQLDSITALKELSESIDKGEKYDAVNLSVDESVNIEDIVKGTGLPVTRENLAQYRDKIREMLKADDSPESKKVNERLEYIEKITAKGVPVYVAAGNVGKNQANIYSFAKGAISVGALETDGKTKTQYSADNSLVNRWEQGDYPVISIKDSKGNLIGYDFNGDNRPDILAQNTSSRNSIFGSSNNQSIRGSSFSAPTALGKDLRSIFGGACGQ